MDLRKNVGGPLCRVALVAALLLGAGTPRAALAWFDATHVAILQAAGRPGEACSAVAPDAMAAKVPSEKFNHWHNLALDQKVDAARVLQQVARVDGVDPEGHLYGAALVAFREVRAAFAQGRRRSYWVGFLGHYLGDLAQPLHNAPHDAFNVAHHRRIDGLVDDFVDLPAQIRQRMPELHLADEAAWVEALVVLANQARAEARPLVAGEPWPAERALIQLGRAAALLHAAVDLAQRGAPKAAPSSDTH